MDVAPLFQSLESNQPKVVEDIKSKFHELFNLTKDAWLINGFFDYYLTTNSIRVVEVLAGVREPHDKFLFDRLTDSLRGSSKLQALTLLGHIVRKQPAWLYKISQHQLLRELLKLLRLETDILPMMSALLLLIVLLPMIPGYISPFLQEIFEVFCHVASWNTLNPAKLSEAYLVHLQVGLYALFLHLYGMFPCNFLAFLRQRYGLPENLNIFRHTIKPMLDSMRLHPLLVTATKDAEIMQERWKNKGHHDVIVECAKFALERVQSPEIQQYSSQTSNLEPGIDNMKERMIRFVRHTPSDFWSPSMSPGLQTPPIDEPLTPLLQSYGSGQSRKEGTTPPEAAIEATPETTPVRPDLHIPPHIPTHSAVKRALALTGKVSTSPSHSNPSSPIKKEVSPFRFGDESIGRSAIHKLVNDRQKVLEASKNGQSEELPEECSVHVVDSVMHDPHPARPIEAVELEECADSPCPLGGLHMPNKRSFMDFAQRVNRLRVHSVCLPCPTLSAGTSPSENIQIPINSKVRRAASCPDMKRSWSNSLTSTNEAVLENQNEFQDETVAVNGSQVVEDKQCLSLGTQTSIEQWPTQPYEHLFLSVFPSHPEIVAQESHFCPYSMLSKYINASIQEFDLHHVESKKVRMQELETQVKSLQGQLNLLHLQLQFERHRREVHAERNRRLAGKSRSNRALEEHNAALKEQVVLLQKDYEKLQAELDNKRMRMLQSDQAHENEILFWKNKFDTQHKENQELLLANQDLQNSLKKHLEDNKLLYKELEQANSTIFDMSSELKLLQDCATFGERLGNELSQLQREMMLLGEFQMRQNEHLQHLPLIPQINEETSLIKEASREALSAMKLQLESRNSALEAARSRVLELEKTVNQKDVALVEQKRLIQTVKGEYSAKLQATEDKYKAVRSINRKLEEEIISLCHKIEVLQARSVPNTPVQQQQEQSSSPLSETLKPITTVTTLPEMTDLHSIIDRDLPPAPHSSKQDNPGNM